MTAGFALFAILFFSNRIPGLPAVFDNKGVFASDTILSSQIQEDMALTAQEQAQPAAEASAFIGATLPYFCHRGYSALALENTMEAFDMALEQGYPQIELDVRQSEDGKLYVSHDDSLMRVFGLDLYVSSSSSDVLDAVRASSGEGMPSLQKVLDTYGTGMKYLIELKEGVQAVPAFLELLEQYPDLIPCMEVQTWDLESLEQIKQARPELFCQLLLASLSLYDQALESSFVDGLALEQSLLSQSVVQAVHQAGKECWVWTLDDPAALMRFLEWGADGFISDDPGSLIEQLQH